MTRLDCGSKYHAELMSSRALRRDDLVLPLRMQATAVAVVSGSGAGKRNTVDGIEYLGSALPVVR